LQSVAEPGWGGVSYLQPALNAVAPQPSATGGARNSSADQAVPIFRRTDHIARVSWRYFINGLEVRKAASPK